MESLLIVQTTLPDAASAKTLAAALIEKRLAACAQIAGPVVSVYRWQGKVEQQQEFVLTAKVCRKDHAKVADFFAARHPYEVPEVITFPVSMVNEAYLRWALDACGRLPAAT